MHKQRLIEDGTGPLRKLKVLDISRLLAGNFLSFHLAEFGAEVIKVEDPIHGDPLRNFSVKGNTVQWDVYARNKKSVALDLKTEKGKELLWELIPECDVLIENYKPGMLEKIGFAPELILKANPKMIVVRISGWGQTGPYGAKPGFGTLIEAFSGFAAKTGFPSTPPLLPNLGLADLISGVTGAFAVVAAIREVENGNGEGQVIDLSLLESMTTFLASDPHVCSVTGQPIKRLGNRGEVAAPRNLYLCSDGNYLAISASMQSMVEKLFRAMDREDLLENPRFATNEDRVENNDELDEIVREFVSRRSLEENLSFFEERGITVGPLHDAISILGDQHIIDREVYVQAETGKGKYFPTSNTAPRLSKTPGGVHHQAPEIGEHTTEILLRLGKDKKYLADLETNGVVKLG